MTRAKMQAQLDRCCGSFPKPSAKPRPKTGIEREAEDRLEDLHDEYKRAFWEER